MTLMCGGGYIKIKDGNIDLVMPGTFTVKAAKYDFQGPASQTIALPSWTHGLLPTTGGHEIDFSG